MKNNIFNHLFVMFAMLLGLSSCQDREIITINPESPAIVMDLSAETLFLDSNFPSNPALTVTWSRATFDVPVETKYRVEISSTEKFDDALELTSTTRSQNYASFTAADLNSAAKKLGFAPAVARQMFFRVVSFIGTDAFTESSNVTSVMITPYASAPVYDFVDLYLIGNATAADWDNEADNDNMFPLLKTSTAGKYTFTGYFKAGGFKMVKVKGSWDAQFGLGAAPGLLSTDGGSGDIPVATEGYYTLTVDTADLTYTFLPATVSSTTYSNISIIGTVNGNWDTDTQLTQSAFDPHVWTAFNVALNAGEFKFRANNAWDKSWGTNAEFFGTATDNGANIPLAAEWTYDIYFNDATGAYTLIPVR